MSAAQASEYRAFEGVLCGTVHVFIVMRGDRRIDVFRTMPAAAHAARLLNQGLATVDPHALVGCRVIAN